MTGHPWLSPFWVGERPQKRNGSTEPGHAHALVPSNLEGVNYMSRVDEYRRYAAECLRIAQETSDPDAKARLLNMAQKWRELGKKAEGGRRERCRS